tara:strand:- start:1338 stop:1457 length:120 start_codon:yes stop_codon:yes gene_type:complete
MYHSLELKMAPSSNRADTRTLGLRLPDRDATGASLQLRV